MNYDFDSTILNSIKAIISMHNITPISEFYNEEGFNQLISHYSFPSYSRVDIYKRKEFIRKCKTALNFFIEYPITFSYSNSCINFLIQQKNAISPKLTDFYDRFILFSFLSWMQNYLRSGDDDDILNLMKSLLINPSSLNFDCFFSLYFIVIQKQPTTQLETIFSLLNEAFAVMKPPDYSFSLLSSHFSILLENDNNENKTFSKEIDQMTNFISKLFMDESSQITTQVAEDFYNSIKSFLIEKFDTRALLIFSNLSPFLSYQSKNDVISEFPLKIIQHIYNQPKPYISIICGKNDTIPEIKSDIFGLNPKMNFLSPSFNQGKDSNNDDLKIAFFPQTTFDDICDKNIIFILALVSKSITSKKEDSSSLFEVFFEKFKNSIEKRKPDKFSFDIYGAYLFFCHINEYYKNTQYLTSIFLKYGIWSSEYSIFQNDLNQNEFKIINAFRYFSLNLVINQESASPFIIFFKEILKNPIILIELSERLQYLHFSLLAKIFIKENSLLNTICYAIESFVRKKDDPYDKIFEYAKFSLFKLLSKLMKEKEIIPIIFNDSLFLSFYFFFIFDVQMEEYILKEIKMFLIDGCDEISTIFIDSFYSKLFIQVLHNFKESSKCQELTVKLINTLFDVFKVKPHYSKEFSFIIYPFLNEVQRLQKPNNDEAKAKMFKFFEVIFQYFDYLNHEDIPDDTIEYIHGLIFSKHLIDCDDNFFHLIIDKMAKNNIIVQKLLARLLFYCFWNKKSDQIIDLFTNYCRINSINCLELHEIEIDSFIIDEMISSISLKNEEIEKRLILFEQIALVVSSQKIVQKFLSLLEKKSIFYALFSKKLFLFNESIPIYFFPFNHIVENEFKCDSDTFSFTIWIYVENENDLLSIFHLNGNETIKIYERKLFVDDFFVFDIPIKKWVFLAFSFNNTEVICSLDTEKSVVCKFYSAKKQHSVKYKIGDIGNMNGKYGNFGLYPIFTKEQINYLFKYGPHNLSFPYFSFYEYASQKTIMNMKLQSIQNFPQIFIQKNRIQFILYFFGQLTEYNYKIITSILHNCLLFDVSQQEYFDETNGFGVISYLLISNNVKHLTYDFYLFFYDLFQEITLQKLKNTLIKTVLINFRLWSRSLEFLRIVQHWKTILFPNNKYVSDLIQLIDLLVLMRVFLYYKPIETNIINPEPIAQFDKINEIRKNIIEIMIQNYIGLLNKFDYALLMYHLIDCQDKLQVQDLLLLFEILAKNPSESLVSFMDNTEIYLTLHTLLASNDTNIIMTTLSIISYFRRSNLLTYISIDEMMFIFHLQMINSQINAEIINKMISLLSDDIPELFPFCCCYSLMLDDQHKEKRFFLKIFQSIKPSKKLVTSPIWALWAVYGAIIQNKEEIIFFLIQCLKSDYFYIYSLVDRICQVFNFDGIYWKSILINFIADDIYNSIEDNSLQNFNIEDFIDLSFYFIFFRKYQLYHNPALIQIYNNFCREANETPEKYKNIPLYSIPYSDSQCFKNIISVLNQAPYLLPPIEQKANKNDNDHLFETLNKIIDSCLFESQLVFGIRLNEKGVWLDHNISNKIKIIIDTLPYKSQDKFKNSLIYFLDNLHLPDDFDIKYLDDSNIIRNPNDLIISIRKYSENACEKFKKYLLYTPEALQIYGQKMLNLTKKSFLSNFEMDSIKSDYLSNSINDKEINESNEKASVDIKSNKNSIKHQKELKSIEITFIDSEEMKKIQKIELIGQGSQSIIYKVFYYKYLALKELKAFENKNDFFNNFQRFFREFEIANRFDHPNILKTQGFFVGDENIPPSILFELMPFNLKQVINELTDCERITIIYEISSALKEMHDSNMIHRDLKPENILLDENKHVKVSDFGISCLLDVEAQVKSMTTGIGTLKFMAPELLIENKHYNEKVDVFSFGVVVFFILTKGQYPESSIVDVVSGKKAPIPDSVNKISKDLINWCWSLEADKRPSFSQIIEYITNNEFNLIDGIQNEIHQIKGFLLI